MVTNRKGVDIKGLNLEINAALYERLHSYSLKYHIKKRQIVSEALVIWLNERKAGN